MKHFRSIEMYNAYKAYRESRSPDEPCELCGRPPIKSFTHWKIIPNHFPYDHIAEKHDMLVPVEHIAHEKDFNRDQYEELLLIKSEWLDEYEFILEATRDHKSIPSHFHLHLLVAKK